MKANIKDMRTERIDYSNDDVQFLIEEFTKVLYENTQYSIRRLERAEFEIQSLKELCAEYEKTIKTKKKGTRLILFLKKSKIRSFCDIKFFRFRLRQKIDTLLRIVVNNGIIGAMKIIAKKILR